MPPQRHNRFQRPNRHVRFLSEERETADVEDVELGQYTHNLSEIPSDGPSEFPGSDPKTTNKPQVQYLQPSTQRHKISVVPSSSGFHGRHSPWKGPASTRRRPGPASRSISKVISLLKLSLMMLLVGNIPSLIVTDKSWQRAPPVRHLSLQHSHCCLPGRNRFGNRSHQRSFYVPQSP